MGISKVGEERYHNMERRLLCRAKMLHPDKLTGKCYWVTGAYLRFEKANYCFIEEEPADNVVHYIIRTEQGDWNMENTLQKIEVDPDTLRQYTGCQDKNNRMIFEGDELLVGDKKLLVVFDTQTRSFMLRLYLEDENRITYIGFDRTFVRQYERIEEE